jgi:hypothetical protein
MIALNVTDEGSKIVTSVPTKASGKPGKIDTSDRQPFVVAVVNEGTDIIGTGTAEVSVNPDGSLATTVHHGVLPDGVNFEVTTFKLKADADLDPGEEREIEETIISTTTRSEVTSLNSTVGEEIPDA